jgi:peptide/nickel transport system substrate-binding protein
MKKHNDSILRVGLLAPVRSFDPHGAWEMGRALVASQIFETPYRTAHGDDDGAVPSLFAAPLVAESTNSSGGQVFSARLRPGVRFSDGSPLDLQQVAHSFARSRVLEGRAKVETRTDRIIFTLQHPNARFDLALTVLDCAIVREAGGILLGTGPFIPAEATDGCLFRLVKNPHHEADGRIEEIRFDVYPPDDDGTPRRLLEAFEKGDVDYTNVLSLEHMGTLLGVRKYLEPGNSTALLFFNTERFPDPLLRRALALAIDRSKIASLFYKNPLAYTATGLLPPKLGGALDGLQHDLEAAHRHLREITTPVPKSISLRVLWSPRNYLPQPQRVARILAEQISALGISLEVENLTGPDEFNQRIATGDYDLYLGGWIADSPDPTDFLESLLSSGAIPQPDLELSSHANFSRWRNSEVDETISQLRGDPDSRFRSTVLRLVAQHVPVFPLLYGPATAVHSWRLEGFRLNAFGHPRFASMSL